MPHADLPALAQDDRDGLRTCCLSGFLLRAAKRRKWRNTAVALALRGEGGQFYSLTARRILQRYNGVGIGAYSYGECFVPGAFAAGVTVGRYVSIAPGVRAFVRNHPVER